jgi:phosphoribosyl-AMP cyclohydrolase
MDTERETGLELNPKFDDKGLVTAVITNADDGAVLMIGHMNADALAKTFETGNVHFFSRNRNKLWEKGEMSGNYLVLVDALIDCDQDALWIKATPAGPTCHTNRTSCFYRRISGAGLEFV